MGAENKKTVCWSCGGQNGHHHPDCDNPTQISYRPPINPPPVCGLSGQTPDITSDKEEKVHYCCNCHKQYKTTLYNWLYGTCPHCGAKGNN